MPRHAHSDFSPPWLKWRYLALFVTAACNAPVKPAALDFAAPAASGVVLAQVGNVAITDAQLVAYEGLDPNGPHRPSVTQLRAKVEDRVRFELLAQAARDRGLAHDPEVIETARKAMVRRLLADEMDAARPSYALDENAIMAYYALHRGSYQQPEMRRFLSLAFGNDVLGRAQAEAFGRVWHDEGDDAQALAAALKVRAVGPMRAASLRRRKTAPLRWQEQPFLDQRTVARSFGDDVAEAVFARPPLSFPTAVVESQRGPIAVRVLACRAAQDRPFSQVKDEIAEQLLRNKRTHAFQQYLEKIRVNYPIAIYEDRVRAWVAATPFAQPTLGAEGGR